MKAELDMKKLQRDLEKFSKQFGDSSAQAVTRWGVQVARELAKDTYARGRKKGERGAEEKGVSAQRQQLDAIRKDALNVLLVVDSLRSTGRSFRATNQGKSYPVQASKIITDERAVMTWVDQHRKGRRRRTRKLPVEEKRVITKATMTKYMRLKKDRIGIAKGAWVNAGMQLVRAQTGAGRVTISPSYLAYARKAARGAGSAQAAKSGFNPTAELNNPVSYSSDSEILPSRDLNGAVAWGLKKTLTWYRMAMRPRKSS